MRTKQGGRPGGGVSFPAGCRTAMETEAGGPGSGSTKRKRPTIRTKQGEGGHGSMSKKKRKQAPAGSRAGEEVRVAGDQGPPPGSGEHGTDRISLIPDAILGEIVSMLPTKEGARTQLLGSRWRHIWRSAPLNLDCGDLDRGRDPTKTSALDRVVSRILTSHEAPVRRVCIPTGHGCAEATVEAWLQSPTLDNLHELEFGYVRNRGPPHSWWEVSLPPACTFRFAATLRVVNIGKCHLRDNIVRGLHFPKLKHLALQSVRISEWSIHHLIAGCPDLECLLIYYIFGFDCLKINALRLTSISVLTYCRQGSSMSHPWLQKLVIENAPCLERLLRLDVLDGMQVSVISAPKLETLGYANNGRPFFSSIVERLCSDDSRHTVVHAVKSLDVRMNALDLDKVIDLMRCFPCLEKLYIRNELMPVKGLRPKNYWRRKHRNLIGCLDIRLKTIVLETYRGTLSEVNFVEFFVLNARELELMRIQVQTMDEEFIAKQEMLLQLEKKASRGARFYFRTDRCLQDISDICSP